MNRKIGIMGIVAALFFSALLFTQSGTNAATQNLVVHFIDVGQGDATFIQTPQGENILIDAGNRAKGHDVVAYLKKQNVKTINYLIATHPDADHIGGLDEVINAFKIVNIYAPKVSHTTQAYKDFLNAVKKKNYKITTAKSGVKLPVKDKSVTASFLAPVKDYSTSDLNNWSAVLHVKYNKNTFLFTGDIESKGEKDLISKKLLSKVDVLKISHHGAKEASTSEFLNIVKPKYAMISVGKGNQYKHPTPETLKRLSAIKANIYRTDVSGTITATSDGNTIKINAKPSQVSEPVTNPSYKLTASLDNKTPKQYSTINLTVNGLPKGTKYTAVFNYKSTKSTYYGKVGEKLPVKISRAAIGYTVKVDVSSSYKGKTYKTQTSFTPK
ncbi:beta-lactamase superfamily II metal-dependent hydrolase [Lederbergia wuyishanensis]|uniref:Beta-lactamase superfamily II metal-dependent hydrolase n=1 Tax=Lederbergia wuyishanensis TaxID=1347903 RepID=A0ABU0D7J7_9BACI|nr:ComEC/Rec2 family competence protein [Lederbergia wuyishanensis]MDQ0344379.1 beta-lactamase superfamily II metal-dependent hydrolase [Lederbergia wuyishanensis]